MVCCVRSLCLTMEQLTDVKSALAGLQGNLKYIYGIYGCVIVIPRGRHFERCTLRDILNSR